MEIIKKDSKVHNKITQTIENYHKVSKIGQNTVIQNEVFEQVFNIMGDTTEDKDIKIEQKDNRIDFFGKKRITRL